MTTPYERYRAIQQAKELLQELEKGKLTDISEIQRWARGVLRHFPNKMELDMITQVNNQNTIFGCMLNHEPFYLPNVNIQQTIEETHNTKQQNMKRFVHEEDQENLKGDS